jgi:hypothetical protein
MIDINNEDITLNHTFNQQMHTNDDTNMLTNDFDRYAKHVIEILEISITSQVFSRVEHL